MCQIVEWNSAAEQCRRLRRSGRQVEHPPIGGLPATRSTEIWNEPGAGQSRSALSNTQHARGGRAGDATDH
jgi:hypothetical protein